MDDISNASVGIEHLIGDATSPTREGNIIITHVCNDIGAWGRGFVLSLTRRWPRAEQAYRQWYQGNVPEMDGQPMELGAVQFVPVAYVGNPPSWSRTFVANMIGQHGILPKADTSPIRYDALETCLNSVNQFIKHLGQATVHMPRIGCGLAGGRWSEIEPIIHRTLQTQVYVYDYVGGDGLSTVPWQK